MKGGCCGCPAASSYSAQPAAHAQRNWAASASYSSAMGGVGLLLAAKMVGVAASVVVLGLSYSGSSVGVERRRNERRRRTMDLSCFVCE